jgi:hypothetical protein
MTTKVNTTFLKRKYPQINSIFYGTWDEAINKALSFQLRRNYESTRLNYECIVKLYYPFITSKDETKALTDRYSDHFNKKKHQFVDMWKSSLPFIFDGIESQKKPISIVDLPLEELTQQKEKEQPVLITQEQSNQLFTISVSSTDPDNVSCKFDNLSPLVVSKIITYINSELFSIV